MHAAPFCKRLFSVLSLVLLSALAADYKAQCDISISVSASSVCAGESVIFNAIEDNGTLVSADWDFGDGNSISGTSVTHSFPSGILGDTTFLVTLNATCSAGSDVSTTTMAVAYNPQITLISDLGSATGCEGGPITFTASPSGLNNYDFSSGSNVLQSGSSATFTTTTLSDGETLTVVANSNNCLSAPSNGVSVDIDTSLPSPLLNCGTSTHSTINYTWYSVPGATAYEVRVDGGSFISPSSGASGLSHSLSGLTQGESHVLEVRALGATGCGYSLLSNQANCSAENCSPVILSFSYDDEVCAGDLVSITSNNTNPNVDLIWSGAIGNGNNTFNFTATTSGTITCIVKDAGQTNCASRIELFPLTVNPAPGISLSLSSDSICSGDTVSFTATPSGYDSYRFYTNTGDLQLSALNTYSSFSLNSGTDVLVVAEENGCWSSPSTAGTLYVGVPLGVPNANCGSTTNSQVGFAWDAIPGATGYLISVNGGAWQNPSGGSGLTHVVTGLSAGTPVSIEVKAKGNGPCGNSDVSDVKTCQAIPCTAIAYNYGGSLSVCEGGNATISLSNLSISNYQITWGNGTPGTQTSHTIAPTGDSLVAVSVSNLDQPSCPATVKYVPVAVKPMPQIALTSTPVGTSVCENSPVTITATPSGFDNYSFYKGYLNYQNTANNTLVVNSWTDGDTIFVSATESGCSNTTPEYVTFSVAQQIVPPQTNCGTTTLNSIEFEWAPVPGATGYLVQVDGGAAIAPNGTLNHSLTGLLTGESHSVTVQALGPAPCGNSALSTELTCSALNCNPVTFDVISDTTVCSEDTITYSATNISAGATSIVWNENPTLNTATIQFAANQDMLLKVSIKDNSQPGCPPTIKAIDLEVKPLPVTTVAPASAIDTICEGTPVTYFASPAGYDNYQFIAAGNTVQNSNYHAALYQFPYTDFEMKVIVSHNGCTYTAESDSVIVIPKPRVSLSTSTGSDTLCGTTASTFTASPAGLGNYTFYLNGTQIQTSASNTYSNNSLIQNNTVRVVVTNAFGCIADSNRISKVTLRPLPVINITSDDNDLQICANEVIRFIVSPGNLGTYTFFNGSTSVYSGSDSAYTVTIPVNGMTISASLTDTWGCMGSDQDTLDLTVIPIPTPVVSGPGATICTGTSVTLTASDPNSGTNFLWNNSMSGASITVAPAVTGYFWVTATLSGCSAVSDSAFVSVESYFPELVIDDSLLVCTGDSGLIEVSGAASYSWTAKPGIWNLTASKLFVTPPVSGYYVVTGTNIVCSSSDSIYVLLDPCPKPVPADLPQVITPNGDGDNDVWEVNGIELYPNNRLYIYNRWGNVVYTADPYSNEWGGLNEKGGELPDGTYYYVLEVGDGAETQKGFIILHR